MTRTVLYIDDSADNLHLVERLLKRRPDVELRVAMTGRDGVSAAIDDPPALILLDNRLPDASGAQILAQLAGTPATAAIPVVILSGDLGRATVDELFAAGAADYLAKPFDIGRFMTVIGRHLLKIFNACGYSWSRRLPGTGVWFSPMGQAPGARGDWSRRRW